MLRLDEYLQAALEQLGPKPVDTAARPEKQAYSQRVSEVLAQAFAAALRDRGLSTARPAPPGELGTSGAERRMSGGIGAKKVDVSWATEESGLILGVSIKTINFRDNKTRNFQKNMTNRRGDMLFEAVTLHRRFPYAVLVGLFVLDAAAADDGTDRRKSTFHNAHQSLKLFTGRDDPAGREEQYERLYVVLFQADRFQPSFTVYEAGDPNTPVSLDTAFSDILQLVAERDFDFYQYDEESEMLRRC